MVYNEGLSSPEQREIHMCGANLTSRSKAPPPLHTRWLRNGGAGQHAR